MNSVIVMVDGADAVTHLSHGWVILITFESRRTRECTSNKSLTPLEIPYNYLLPWNHLFVIHIPLSVPREYFFKIFDQSKILKKCFISAPCLKTCSNPVLYNSVSPVAKGWTVKSRAIIVTFSIQSSVLPFNERFRITRKYFLGITYIVLHLRSSHVMYSL